MLVYLIIIIIIGLSSPSNLTDKVRFKSGLRALGVLSFPRRARALYGSHSGGCPLVNSPPDQFHSLYPKIEIRRDTHGVTSDHVHRKLPSHHESGGCAVRGGVNLRCNVMI